MSHETQTQFSAPQGDRVDSDLDKKVPLGGESSAGATEIEEFTTLEEWLNDLTEVNPESADIAQAFLDRVLPKLMASPDLFKKFIHDERFRFFYEQAELIIAIQKAYREMDRLNTNSWRYKALEDAVNNGVETGQLNQNLGELIYHDYESNGYIGAYWFSSNKYPLNPDIQESIAVTTLTRFKMAYERKIKSLRGKEPISETQYYPDLLEDISISNEWLEKCGPYFE